MISYCEDGKKQNKWSSGELIRSFRFLATLSRVVAVCLVFLGPSVLVGLPFAVDPESLPFFQWNTGLYVFFSGFLVIEGPVWSVFGSH